MEQQLSVELKEMITEHNCLKVISFIKSNYLDQCKNIFSNLHKYRTDNEYREIYKRKQEEYYKQNRDDISKKNRIKYQNRKIKELDILKC